MKILPCLAAVATALFGSHAVAQYPSKPVRIVIPFSTGTTNELTARAIVAIVALVLGVSPARSAEYPSAPVRIFYPSTPGSSGDLFLRKLVDALSQKLNARFLVENRPGAGGAIAAASAAKSQSDGHTLLAVSASFVTTPYLQTNSGYDATKDFTGVASITRSWPTLVVRAGSSAKTIEEFIAAAKKSPGSISLGHAGVGTVSHLPSVLFEKAAGLKLLHVPYRGESQVLADVLGGQLSGMFAYAIVATPQIKAGKLRALAVSRPERNPLFPDVPTMDELGLGGAGFETWFGIVAPRGTPQSIVNLLNREINAFLSNPEVKADLEATGLFLNPGTPAFFDEIIKRDSDKLGQLIRELGLKLD